MHRLRDLFYAAFYLLRPWNAFSIRGDGYIYLPEAPITRQNGVMKIKLSRLE